MGVENAVRTVTVPKQAGPVDPPLTASAPPSAPAPRRAGVPGADRPLTSEERQFILGATITFGGLAAVIVVFLLLATQVW